MTPSTSISYQLPTSKRYDTNTNKVQGKAFYVFLLTVLSLSKYEIKASRISGSATFCHLHLIAGFSNISINTHTLYAHCTTD